MELLREKLGKHISKRFIRYLMWGVINYSIIIPATYGFTNYLGLYYLHSYIISYSIVSVINFIFSMKWIFSVDGRVTHRFTRYITYLTAFTIINVYLVKVTTEVIGLHYLLSIIVVTGSIFIIKYLTYKKKVFNR